MQLKKKHLKIYDKFKTLSTADKRLYLSTYSQWGHWDHTTKNTIDYFKFCKASNSPIIYRSCIKFNEIKEDTTSSLNVKSEVLRLKYSICENT